MSKRESLTNFTVTSGQSTSAVTLEGIQDTVRKLDEKHMLHIRTLIEGTIVIPDETGMMVTPNGYAVIVGKKLWEKLQREKLVEAE